jgi:4-amino-4-deoxy-L-arabinose transferase-like glycosyltransferase
MYLWLLSGLFWINRLYHLSWLPIFLDETIYIRWVHAITADWNKWWLPLKEFGWEPLSIWISSGLNMVVGDSLMSLRLTSVFFGFLTGLVLYLAVKALFDRRTALFSLAVIWFSPLVLLHDRLGLRGDGLVNLAVALTFYGTILRLKAKKSGGAYLISLGIIIGLMAKTSALVLPMSVGLAYLYFRPKLKVHDWLAGLLSLTPAVFYYVTGFLPAVLSKAAVFSLPVVSWGSMGSANLTQMLSWNYQYTTWPAIALIALGAVWLWLTNKKIFWLLLLFVLPTWVLLAVTAKIMFPRYMLPGFLIDLIFAGVGLSYLRQHLPKFFLPGLLIFFLPALFTNYRIINNIAEANLPEIDRWQYITGWPSGYGLRELTNYLRFNPPQVLVTENSDLIRSGVDYLWPEHPFAILPLDDDLQLTDAHQAQLNQVLSARGSAYMAINILEELPDNFSGQLLKEFPRPEGKSSLRLYQLDLEPNAY